MMARAPHMATLFDWPRQDAVRRIEARRRELHEKLEKAKPRSETFFALRGELRALTLEQLRLSVGGRDE